MTSYRRSSNTFTFESMYKCEIKRTPIYKKVVKNVNPYLQHCTSLERISFVFLEMIDLDMIHKDPKKVHWIAEVYQMLPKYIDKYMNPSDDDIDSITQICDVLLRNNLVDAYEAIILNSPDKFLTNYVNIQQNTRLLFYHLKELKLENVCNYLWNYVYVDNILDFDFNI